VGDAVPLVRNIQVIPLVSPFDAVRKRDIFVHEFLPSRSTGSEGRRQSLIIADAMRKEIVNDGRLPVFMSCSSNKRRNVITLVGSPTIFLQSERFTEMKNKG
jgi:hypothetical protein